MQISKYLVRFNLISSSKDKDEKQISLIITIEGIKKYYYIKHRVEPKNFIKIKDKGISLWKIKKNTFNKVGEPIHVVASMSGHSENSKAFDRYRRHPEQLQKESVKRSMD